MYIYIATYALYSVLICVMIFKQSDEHKYTNIQHLQLLILLYITSNFRLLKY